VSDLVEVYLVGGPHNGESVYVFEGSTFYSRDSLRGKSKTSHTYKMQSDRVFMYSGVVGSEKPQLLLVDVDSVLKSNNGRRVVDDFIHQGWTVGCIGTGSIAELHAWLASVELFALDPVISVPDSYDPAEFKLEMVSAFRETGDYERVTLLDMDTDSVSSVLDEFGPESATLFNGEI
jgi:hypothetical protein